MRSRYLGFWVLLLLLLVGIYPGKVALAQDTGTLKGQVEVRISSGGIQTGGGYGNPYQRRNKSSSQSTSSQDPDVLVWLTSNRESPLELRSEPIKLNQKDKAFVPQFLPILQGETVRILNSDPVYHNVFSLSRINRFDVGRRPKGNYKDVLFDKPGVVDVFCDIHSNMHAVVVVMPKSTYAWQLLSGTRSFRFENLPAGEYQLHVVAKGAQPLERTVTIKAGETQSLSTLQLSR